MPGARYHRDSPRQDHAGTEISRRRRPAPARSDLHPIRHRRISAGRGGPADRSRHHRHHVEGRCQHGQARPLGARADGADHSRLPLQERQPPCRWHRVRCCKRCSPFTPTKDGSRSSRPNSNSTSSAAIPTPITPCRPRLAVRAGRRTGRQSYSVDAVNEFDPLFEEMYDFCEVQELDLDTLIHEEGAGQVEINFLHGEPLSRADQVFLFKRTVREVALAARYLRDLHGQADEAGSPAVRCMCIKASSIPVTKQNLFAGEDGRASKLFRKLSRRIAEIHARGHADPGAERELLPPAVTLLERADQPRMGLRQTAPAGCACHTARRLPCVSRTACPAPTPIPTSPSPRRWPAATSAWWRNWSPRSPSKVPPIRCPTPCRGRSARRSRSWSSARAMKDILGPKMIEVLVAVKKLEYETYLHVISSWEREHLLLNV